MDKNYQLKQTCTFLENSKNKIQVATIKDETVTFRINLELQEMEKKLDYQSKVFLDLDEELKESENKIHAVQEKVVQRSVQFSRQVDGESNDDACTYKLWMKDTFAA